MAKRKYWKEALVSGLILSYAGSILIMGNADSALAEPIFAKQEAQVKGTEYLVLREKEVDVRDKFEDRNIYYYISENSTPIYSDPSFQVPVGLANIYDPVLVTGINQKNIVRISFNGEIAYLSGEKVAKDIKDIFLPVNKVMYARQNMNVRNGLKNTPEEVFSSYKKNDEVQVIGENNSNFKKVKTAKGEIGYVFGEYLMAEKEKPKEGFTGKNYSIPDDYKYQVVLATVRHEGGNSYEGALAVMSCVLNRCDSQRWGGGNDPYGVIIAPGQFESYFAGRYKQFMNYNVSAEVRRGVEDALNGKRSHNFESFRANSSSVRSSRPWGTQIAGNWFF